LLQKQGSKAKGPAKAKLKLTITGFNAMLKTYTAAGKKLKH